MKSSAKPQRVVKLRDDVYQRLHTVVDTVVQKGWQHVGSSRRDRPTMSSVVDEALGHLLSPAVSAPSGKRRVRRLPTSES